MTCTPFKIPNVQSVESSKVGAIISCDSAYDVRLKERLRTARLRQVRFRKARFNKAKLHKERLRKRHINQSQVKQSMIM